MRRDFNLRSSKCVWILAVAVVLVAASWSSAQLADWPRPIGAFLDPGVAAGRMATNPNVPAARILSKLDIDADGLPDQTPDTDGDGLPDNWEIGGAETIAADGSTPDRVVFFPAPTAIGPGTPPTFIFARLAVATSSQTADTDHDGLSDFIEVFGLKFIDDNGNGKLDFSFTDANGNGTWDVGETISADSEWLDANGDGLPSVGEYPLANIDPSRNQDNDFDGFIFTDPTNPDTDGDGILDGLDIDPLINPQTFNVQDLSFARSGASPADTDLDNDGLGNGSDFGNDLTGQVDFPQDLGDLLKIFRTDLLNEGRIPEAVIEDLLGVDWDGNGLFRVTDIRDWTPVIDAARMATFTMGTTQLFSIGANNLFREQTFAEIQSARPLAYGRHQVGMGFQTLLQPASRSAPFMPDVRIWAILYAWRVPGFDIDGDGFVGAPSPAQGFTAPLAAGSNTVSLVLINGVPANDQLFGGSNQQPFDDRQMLSNFDERRLDGRIDPGGLCSISGLFGLVILFCGLSALLPSRRHGQE